MYASTQKCCPGGKIGLLNTAYPELLRAFMGKADAEEGTLGTAGPRQVAMAGEEVLDIAVAPGGDGNANFLVGGREDDSGDMGGLYGL